MHPIIAEIARVKTGESIRPEVFRRWQHALQFQVQPLLDERDRMAAERDALKSQKPKAVNA